MVLCKYCQQYAAEYYCKNCRGGICQTYQVSHKGDHIFSNHAIVPYYERKTAGNRYRYPIHFYNQGCQKCSIPICPECKIQSHLKHKNTDITTVWKKARKTIQNGLTDMQNKERDVENYLTKEVGYGRSQSQEIFQYRATEMKICIDNLSKSIEVVEQKENDYQRSVENILENIRTL